MHAGMPANSVTCGVAEADCQRAGIFWAAYRVVAGSARGAEEGQAADWQPLMTQEPQYIVGDWRRDLNGDRNVVALPDVMFRDFWCDRRKVACIGFPQDATLQDCYVRVGNHPQCSADGERGRLAEAAGDGDV